MIHQEQRDAVGLANSISVEDSRVGLCIFGGGALSFPEWFVGGDGNAVD